MLTTNYGLRTTLHASRTAAEVIATAHRAEDADWTYTVIENAAGKFVVQIFDEDGEFVANL